LIQTRTKKDFPYWNDATNCHEDCATTSITGRQFTEVIENIRVYGAKRATLAPEPTELQGHNHDEERSPVRKQTSNIGQNLAKGFASGYGCYEIDNSEEGNPNNSWDFHQDWMKSLHTQCSRICVGYVAGNGGEHEDHEEELPEAADGLKDLPYEATKRSFLVSCNICGVLEPCQLCITIKLVFSVL
jgi:hypothetical protein